jgi:hypothetical protein
VKGITVSPFALWKRIRYDGFVGKNGLAEQLDVDVACDMSMEALMSILKTCPDAKLDSV